MRHYVENKSVSDSVSYYRKTSEAGKQHRVQGRWPQNTKAVGRAADPTKLNPSMVLAKMALQPLVRFSIIPCMQEEPRQSEEREKRPWHILFILLVSLMPATANTFLYSFVLLTTATEWGVTTFWAAIIGFMPMAIQPVGGLIFGSLSDHYGRRNALLLTIFLSAVSAVLSGISCGPVDFGVYRLVLGMVIGGQWAVSMTLVSEIWPAAERGRAVGIVQTGFPFGFIYASLIAFWAGARLGWRPLLVLGGLPALIAAPLALYALRESSLWVMDTAKRGTQPISYRELFSPDLLKHTVLGTVVVFIGSFGAWSLNPWIPVYLAGLGVPPEKIPLFTFFIMTGALTGYALYGFISDGLGRKLTFKVFFIGMAVGLASFGLIPSRNWFLGETGHPIVLTTLLGASAAFFLGYFSGYGSLLAELFPTRIRSRGLGFCYTIGSIGSALGPASTGFISSRVGIGNTFILVSLIFLIGAAAVSLFPETRGKRL
jgi:MFS family permease